MATLPALSAAETLAAEALLARVWGPAPVRAAEPIWDRSHVVRLHLVTGRCVVLKKRADEDSFGAELAALEYLNEMPEPVAPRLLGADAEAGIVLMEDLGPGPSLADSLLTGDHSRVQADLVSYASRTSCPGRRTARAAIGALARGGHRGLPGPRPAWFGAGSGPRLLAARGLSSAAGPAGLAITEVAERAPMPMSGNRVS